MRHEVDSVTLEEVVRAARAAGDAVLEVYGRELAPRVKADGSPLTDADERSQEIIVGTLAALAPDVPIIAEEGPAPRPEIHDGGAFWLVDPLDGTKEFVSRNGEFTINIALVAGGVPVLGVVLAPALERLFAAASGEGVFVEDALGRRPISARTIPAEGATVVASRSHSDPEALAGFICDRKIAAVRSAGSSLKFCLVAAGEADLYPRFGRTMEWDTAAGDGVLRAAGGTVSTLDGRPLTYGKPGFENPHFLAAGLPPEQSAG